MVIRVAQMKTRIMGLLLICCCSCFAADTITEDGQKQLKASEEAIERYLDRQVREAEKERDASWKRDLSGIAAYEKSIEPWRGKLWQLLGGSNYQSVPLNPKLELIKEFDGYKAYRVWLTAFEDVTVYGVMLVPKGDGQFPALICVHGMTGTPESLCGLTEKPDYHNRLGAQAVEKGYLVFAPLNVNTQKRRSWLDRKAIMVGQRLQALEQFKFWRVTDYLSGRPDVDPKRIGAYGISWGGRTVMNAAALDKRIAACAISGHFNDLVPKMIEPSPHYTAFIETAEDYAFFSNHARLFTDADVVSLICPRPFLIEQGRQDRVVWWPMSQRAFNQVKSIYQKLGIPDRAVYAIFDGPHEIHGVEAFEFFQKWLQPKKLN